MKESVVKKQRTDKGSEFLEMRVDVYLWADFCSRIDNP